MNLTPKSALIFPKTKPKDEHSKKARRKKSYVSRKERKKLNLIKCPKKGWEYKAFSGLRDMWRQYMRSYLDIGERMPTVEDKEWANFSLMLAKADYHGAEMTVVRSKCPSLIGITGTCIMDTKNTFQLLCPDNKCRRKKYIFKLLSFTYIFCLSVIPKQDSVFTIVLDNMKLTIYGKYIMYKPADRSAKKLKSSIVPTL